MDNLHTRVLSLMAKPKHNTITANVDPNPAAGQAGHQTMKWTTIGNVSVTANNTTTVALP